MTSLVQTPSQTVGPFFNVGLSDARTCSNVLVDDQTNGERIRVEGTVFDGAGAPVDDALIEIWQANAQGRYRHPLDAGPAPLDPHFLGFGRAGTDARGRFFFTTIKPSPTHGPDGRPRSPHLNVIVFARGMLLHAFTRMYFSDDVAIDDPVLAQVDSGRRRTIIGQRTERGGEIVYAWDVHLQGDAETVFFDA